MHTASTMAKEKGPPWDLSEADLPLHNSNKQEHSSPPTNAQKLTDNLLLLLKISFLSIFILTVHFFASLFLAFPLSGGVLWLLRLHPNSNPPPFIPRLWDWLFLNPPPSSSSPSTNGIIRGIIHTILWLPSHLLPIKKDPFVDAKTSDISMCLVFHLPLGMDLLCLAYWAARWPVVGWKSGIRRLGIWESDAEEVITTVRRILKQTPGWWKPITLYYLCAAEMGYQYISYSGALLDAWRKPKREPTTTTPAPAPGTETEAEAKTKMIAKTAITIFGGYLLACYFLTIVFLFLCIVARGVYIILNKVIQYI